MEDNRIIDNSMPHPEQEEPIESDYTICAWMPMMVQATVTATDETDAIENAKYQIKNGQVPYKVVEKDFSEMDVTFVEKA
ncbi:hypothetical protein FEZ48_06345 [Marinilactibacillus psychrotolerans]|uniref:Uncharacterized protein n=1 Tax=Marinilactibacillus psychrotolerans TaxID=191770 RepID=A0A5R9C402_9LACT|nr:hypothetical protein [Marinilactibacillus psychrotolerans]TLQ07597.1 hypothetical protein FEZ48_06345 [Marinilactibacillus psychrotolerans]